MRLFRKAPQEPFNINDDEWNVSSGEYDGKPIILRLNEGLRALIGTRKYPLQAGVAIPCNHPDDRGFPSPDELDALSTFEEQLVALLCGDNRALFAASITTGGMREFVYYLSNEKAFREAFHEWLKTPKSHEVQFMIQPDPSWSVYRTLAAAQGQPSA